MAGHWEVNCKGLVEDTHIVLNLYLKSLKDKDLSRDAVRRYRTTLQSFFLAHRVSYKSITRDEVEAWLTQQRAQKKERTVKDYLKTLRGFYNFCVQEGHLDNFPLNPNLQEISTPDYYWELKTNLPNPDNQLIVNQFLLHMKTLGRTEHTIVALRTYLQRIFKEIDQSLRQLTLEEIEQRVIDTHQQRSE